VVVVIGFEIRMSGRSGTMSLCIPFNVIEPVMDKLLSQGWLAYQRRAPADDKSLDVARAISATHVDVIAYLTETTMTLGELLTLQAGDIIQTAKPVDSQLILRVRDENKFAGRLGRHKDHLAIRITRFAEVEEPL
jgi:flagellar motor switch protein FliM